MLNRIAHALSAAAWAFRATLSPQPTRPTRPAWDNGINYDVPTFLRRNAIQSM